MEAGKSGLTSYPLVDAVMRELAASGTMHNRVRMVAASFLRKYLLVHWLERAACFEEMLVNADLTSNTMGWQWVAGSRSDAAPYFRIFNPVVQGQRFDPRGEYVQAWVPELSQVADRWAHAPWQAPTEALTAAGVELGTDYPRPIVDHNEARLRALAAYQSIRQNDGSEAASAMRTFLFETSLWLLDPPHRVFPFFADAANLETIMPS